MSWKSIVITGLLCVVAAPVWAQNAPVISVVPTIGGSTVSWAVSIEPRDSVAAPFVPNSSVAVELDFDYTAAINSFTLNNAFWNIAGGNPGNNPFTGTITETALSGSTLFVAAGSELFAASTPTLLGTIVTAGTSGTLTLGGRTTAGYDTARIAQDGINYNDLGDTWSVGGCITGDFSCNGAVENADLTLLLDSWGDAAATVPVTWIGNRPAPGTFVDNEELTFLLDNWGNVAGSASLSGAAVPEPASIALLGMVCVGACMFRRQK